MAYRFLVAPVAGVWGLGRPWGGGEKREEEEGNPF